MPLPAATSLDGAVGHGPQGQQRPLVVGEVVDVLRDTLFSETVQGLELGRRAVRFPAGDSGHDVRLKLP